MKKNSLIDYLEEVASKLKSFEFKWRKQKIKPPSLFLETYPEGEFELIHQKNYQKFVGLSLN